MLNVCKARRLCPSQCYCIHGSWARVQPFLEEHVLLTNTDQLQKIEIKSEPQVQTACGILFSTSHVWKKKKKKQAKSHVLLNRVYPKYYFTVQFLEVTRCFRISFLNQAWKSTVCVPHQHTSGWGSHMPGAQRPPVTSSCHIRQGRDHNTSSFTYLFVFLLIYLFILLYRAIPAAYGSSQARDWIQAELKLLAYATATATPDPCGVCDRPTPQLTRQRRIFNPLSKARDQICVLMDTSQIHFRWATTVTPEVVSLVIKWFGQIHLLTWWPEPGQGKLSPSEWQVTHRRRRKLSQTPKELCLCSSFRRHCLAGHRNHRT